MLDKSCNQTANYKICIVMGTYNGEKYLAEQIESIIHQTYQDWCLLIRDDGSKDSTVEIIRSYSAKYEQIFLLEDQEGNFGFNRNFLKLIECAQSPYISICDQDDVWLPNKLEKSLQALQAIELSTSMPALVHSDAFLVDSDLNRITDKWIGQRGTIDGFNGVSFANSVQGASLMFNQALKKIALSTPILAPYDYHLALLSSLRGKRFFINESLLYYRQHSHNAIGGMAADSKINTRFYFNQLINLIKSLVTSLNYERLNPTLKHSFQAYKIIKDNYSLGAISETQSKPLAEYLYIFEGNNIFKKLYFFIKNRYGFSSKKDRLLFLFLIITGRNLSDPNQWK